MSNKAESRSAAKADFGAFMAGLAKDDASPATKKTLEELGAKLEAEKQAEVERKLRAVFAAMQRWVTELRSIRKRESDIKAEIKKLEGQANDIVAGKL
jgi:hypothetical protein